MQNHKNDYSLIVFDRLNRQICKIEFCHKLSSASSWLSGSKKYSDWNYFNVYDRRTGEFLKRFYKDNFIPAFL